MKHHLKYSFLALSILVISCHQSPIEEKLPEIIEIDSGWQFSQADKSEWLPAIVPGTVHADLLNNGIIDDPHYRLQEKDVQWIETVDWVYKTTFNVKRHIIQSSNIELQFKGLDTYADVFLNDNLILKGENMFVEYEADVKKFLKEGENKLMIYFHSPVNEGMKKLERLNYLLPATNEQAPENKRTSIFTRKAPFHYGWDWGPRLVTSGIWQPVCLKAWNTAIISDVYVNTLSAQADKAKIVSKINVDVLESGEYALLVNIEGQSDEIKKKVVLKKGINTVDFDINIENPKLWWTNGLGEPYLYNFRFTLQKENFIIDKYEIPYGIRTLRLIQDADRSGYSFHFELNGVPVFMKGANIIPPNTLTSSVTKNDYNILIKNIVDANMNMIRIWGGAIYGEDYLYELCNRNGILVWQDFMFACALQPDDDAHLENIRKEAEYNIKRLRNNPSLALWCGNNEIFHGWHNWGWNKMYTPEIRDSVWKTYEKIFYNILSEAVSTNDPSRSYHSSSPISYANKPADRKSGDEHDWTVWFGQYPFVAYDEHIPRFVSEYGMQSFSEMKTIKSFSIEEDWDINSPVMKHRQKGKMDYIRSGYNGNDLIKWYMSKYYDVPNDFEDFVYVSQLLQAMGYKTAIESHRRAMPHCMGSLFWQLNDSWSAISWSTVDYCNRWKAAHYAVKKAYEPIILSAKTERGKLNVYAVNDNNKRIKVKLIVKSVDFDGKALFNDEVDLILNPLSSKHIYTEDIYDLTGLTPEENSLVLLKLVSNKEIIADNIFYFKFPKEFLLTKNIKPEIEMTNFEGGYQLNITSDKLIKNLFLSLENGDGFFSDNYFDIIPGKAKKIFLETNERIDSVNDIVLKSLNDVQ